MEGRKSTTFRCAKGMTLLEGWHSLFNPEEGSQSCDEGWDFLGCGNSIWKGLKRGTKGKVIGFEALKRNQ